MSFFPKSCFIISFEFNIIDTQYLDMNSKVILRVTDPDFLYKTRPMHRKKNSS